MDLHNYTLGPSISTYGPNAKVTVILGIVGLLLCLLALFVATEAKDLIAWTIFYALTALYGGVLLQQLCSRVWLHETGISWRGILGHGGMRWLEVERIYFSAYEVHAHYIPLGRFYRLKLISTHGQKVSLGERVRGGQELIGEIAKFTLKPMMEKAKLSFDNGQTVEFGAIHVNRSEGMTVKRWYSDKKIAWQEIEGYECNDSSFEIRRFKKLLAVKVSSEQIANAHVLRALLARVMHHVWQR